MDASFLDFFVDPVLRAPTIGSMLMGLASSLIGATSFIQRRSLLGEALSHAAYPGVGVGVFFSALLFPHSDQMLATFILLGAFISSLLGLVCIHLLQKHMRVKSDAALCFVLSLFFGVGILIASRLQLTHALWYKQIQLFLYGQAATMTDLHVGIYAILAALIVLVFFIFYRPIQAVSFDKPFTESLGLGTRFFESVIFLLLLLSVVIGMRSVGVVLMAGMLIAPAASARQWTHKLSTLFCLSAAFGVLSGFLGNYLSLVLPSALGIRSLALPTGPMILLCSAFFCLSSLLLAPNTGLISRAWRMVKFKERRYQENLLKALWKKGKETDLSLKEIVQCAPLSLLRMRLLLYRLMRSGWIEKAGVGRYRLTPDGSKRAAYVVRLHRLWEVYLVDYLGHTAERVHKSAEEMEHILSPALEKELSDLLNDPKKDPHSQPIPSTGEL